MRIRRWAFIILGISLGACTSSSGSSARATTPGATPESAGYAWLAGDHHIHSRYSVGWNRDSSPPAPVIGGDGMYPIPMNALMGRTFGLRWMVATDHGGPNHSKVNMERAWPELEMSRRAVPEVIQFYGMEFDSPGADHSSIIMPHTHDEVEHLHAVESRFAALDAWPADSTRNRPARMLDALRFLRDLPRRPVLIAHHPSRSATAVGAFGLDTPSELRDWNDAAPEVAVGMEGSPGHQGFALDRTGAIRARGARGGYSRSPTLGGFDQMTAIVGGFWDSMLGEGRRWWVTANSDSHVNWRDGGGDFWPGEYSKTWVWARPDHESVLDGIRNGRVFVTLGDLITGLHVTVRVAPGGGADTATASIGGTLEVPRGSAVEVEVRWHDPSARNAHGDDPSVERVDLITGEVTGRATDRDSARNPSTSVVARFRAAEARREGDWRVVTWRIDRVAGDAYVRVRGTNGHELEPEPDPRGEDPWADLWFYSNPIFIRVR